MLSIRTGIKICSLDTFSSIISNRNVASLPALRIYSIRRRIAEKLSNKHDPERAKNIGPDLACLEWLMECGATKVEMSDSHSIESISAMRDYLRTVTTIPTTSSSSPTDNAYNSQWPTASDVHIVKVDASDSAICNEGFKYFRDCRRLESLKLNFCDYFGDEALRELALGRPSQTLQNIEIVLNPSITDGAVYWLSRLKALKTAHFYFLPYVSNRQAFLRHLKLALPRCKVTFPEIDNIGYGYEK